MCTFIKQEGKLNVKSLKDMLVICVVMSMLNSHLLALKCTNIQFFIFDISDTRFNHASESGRDISKFKAIEVADLQVLIDYYCRC